MYYILFRYAPFYIYYLVIALICADPTGTFRALDILMKGISGDSTFEAELLQNTKHCKVWGYDFSVKGFTSDIPESERWRTNFHAYGLAGKNKPATSNDPAMYSLQTLMAMNGGTNLSY